jgi:UDP-N-acetylmuramoyl-tripeptide--D-alanyl-D-alanine ligase
MTIEIAAVVIGAAFGFGACWRIYKLARFFQLEGYNTARYWRWWARNLPIALLYFPQGEVKQQFTQTQRAMRIVVTACALASFLAVAGALTSTVAAFAFGLLAYLLAPALLPLGNLLMVPVEATLRQGYLRKAKAALEAAGPTVIAITGSYGKTTTKEFLAQMLGGRYRVLKTPKSYNTLMGVCRVINDILPGDASYDYFIVEMGAYLTGEIAAICRLTKPQISLVTAVGPMHLERFGSLDNTARAKYEIIEALPPDGLGVFNLDDVRVRAMEERGYPVRRVGVSRQGQAGARLVAESVLMTAEGMRFEVRDTQSGEVVHVSAPVYGDHNVSNILMTMAVAGQLGISLTEAASRAATLQPAEHRLVRRVLPNGVVTIDDAYSANPIGTREALRVLALHKAADPAKPNKLIVITSGMIELGPIQDAENRKLGAAIAETATDVVLINETMTRPIHEGLQDVKFPAAHIQRVATTTEAIQWMQANARPGDAVLIMSDLPDTY